MKRGRGVGEKVCHGAVIAIYRTSWGMGPYIHPALLGVKEMGGKRWSEKKRIEAPETNGQGHKSFLKH